MAERGENYGACRLLMAYRHRGVVTTTRLIALKVNSPYFFSRSEDVQVRAAALEIPQVHFYGQNVSVRPKPGNLLEVATSSGRQIK